MKKKLIKFLEIDEIKRLQEPLVERAKEAVIKEQKNVKDITAIRDFVVINLVYSCALRISEACNLRLDDLDFNHSKIYIFNAKGGDRIVPLPQVTINNLKMWLQVRPDWKENRYVFTHIKGTTRPGKEKPLQRKYFNDLITELSNKTGIKLKDGKNPSPHVLRHSRAMEIYDNGINLEVLQKLLGHKKIDTTQIYAEVRDERVAEVQENITAGIISL